MIGSVRIGFLYCNGGKIRIRSGKRWCQVLITSLTEGSEQIRMSTHRYFAQTSFRAIETQDQGSNMSEREGCMKNRIRYVVVAVATIVFILGSQMQAHSTLIQVTVNTTAGGSVSVTVNLPQGLSDFAATYWRQVTLSNGQTVTVTSNPVTGTMTISGVSPLSAQTMQQIQSLAQQVAAAIPAIQAFEGVPK